MSTSPLSEERPTTFVLLRNQPNPLVSILKLLEAVKMEKSRAKGAKVVLRTTAEKSPLEQVGKRTFASGQLRMTLIRFVPGLLEQDLV